MMIRVIFLTLMSELLLFHKFYTSVISGRKEKVCFVVFLAKKKKGDFRCASYGSGSKCVSFSDDDEIARIIFLHNRACKHLLL